MSLPPPMGGPLGASIENVYISRSVKVVSLFEHEIEEIAGASVGASIWYAGGSGLASFAAAIVVNAAFQASMTETAKVFTYWVAPACGLGALICFALAIRSTLRGGKILKDLRSKLDTHSA